MSSRNGSLSAADYTKITKGTKGTKGTKATFAGLGPHRITFVNFVPFVTSWLLRWGLALVAPAKFRHVGVARGAAAQNPPKDNPDENADRDVDEVRGVHRVMIADGKARSARSPRPAGAG
jgi:hypothetical protein